MREPFAASVKDQVSLLGGGFMISRYAKAAAAEHGLTDVWSAYFLGRCGVLGDVHPDVVAAATAFYPVDVVREAWTTGRAAVAPDKAADRYALACHEWGQARFDGFAGAAATTSGWTSPSTPQRPRKYADHTSVNPCSRAAALA